MVSGNPCCPRVDPVASRNLSISFVYSYDQKSFFQNKLRASFEIRFDLVEVSQLPYISVVILFNVLNVALALRQGFPATSGEAKVAACKYISSVDR